MSLLDSENVKFINVPVENDKKVEVKPEDDLQKVDNQIKVEIYEPVKQRQDIEFVGKKSKERKKNEGKIFVACLFIGLGLTAALHTPFFLFMGLAAGFLSTLDPIYHKIMDKIEKL